NEYNFFQENRFLSTATSPLSTFAADADTASYAQIRQMILRGDAVTKDAVRIEEMLNYFHYDYNAPRAGEPLGVTMELVRTPWNSQTQLLLIGLKAQEIPQEQRPPQNLVFLIDVSGSMDDPAKLPLVKRAFLLLLEQLAPTDTVSIVTYASMDAVLLDGVRASDRTAIADAIEGLSAGGMTAGAAGITTAYALAEKHFVPGGNNRVLLATDGDLNVGVSDEGSLARLVEEKKKAGVFLSVLGFGDGNYKDNKLEALADHGDGNYAYIDTIHEARRALVSEIGATFFTVAKDVKLQVDFNPAQVRGYRLIGYENRVMAAEDFADDQKDGGELGSGHRLTVLYEIVPIDSAFDFGETGSKYTQPAQAPAEGELLTLSIRAKEPDGDVSKLYEYPLQPGVSETMSDNVRFAAAVAQAGMLLRDSEWKGTATYANTLDLLRGSQSISGDPLKEEFLYLVTLLERASAHGN
ncbi:MAG TPA: von Willebrand factor type A domain-containing protein, partial [Candidatus Limnocylindria bacterium]|nr:von Willebrand factor type A domain-containing protein [Candidatus Limnocylindria bacterium]